MFSCFGCLNARNSANDIVNNMYESLSERGGNSKSVYSDLSISMGLRGDTDYVNQAVVKNVSKSIVAIIEGEIYNEKELCYQLKSELSSFPYNNVFQTVPFLYEKYGKDFPKYINGSFIIALWDSEKKTLYLIRDHLGARSLFYSQSGSQFFFASTVRALFNTGAVQRDISLTGLNSYFSSTAICPPNTMFKNIYCIRPGAMSIYSDGKINEYNYWPIRYITEDFNRSEDDFAQEVRELIIDAVKIRADYGNTCGSLVSGGIDTSIVTSLLANEELYSLKKLPVFSIAFDEHFYSDADLQKIMYQNYNLAPYSAILNAREYWSILQKSVSYLDSPVNDNAFVGMYKAFQLASQAGCNAVFDGEAADEIFYTGHAHSERKYQYFLWIPFKIRQLLFGKKYKTIPLGNSLVKRIQRLMLTLGLPDTERRLLVLPSFYKHSDNILNNNDDIAYHDPLEIERQYLEETDLKDPLNIYYYGLLKAFLPNDLLFKNERMASANGLAVRTPFIDYRLVELAYKIPQKYKIRRPTASDDGTKLIYKKAVKGLIPDEILYRKKQRGFSQPTTLWYRGDLKDVVHDTLFNRNSFSQEYINTEYMEKIFNIHMNNVANFDYLISSLLIFELWMKSYFS